MDKPPADLSELEWELTGELRGYPARVRFRAATAVGLANRLDKLKAAHFTPPAKVTVYDRDADGLPICPKHGVAMTPREKQGDTWHSHAVYGPRGEELWCKGRAGKDSPGWEVE